MTPVIGITTYDEHASWREWSARAATLPWAYVEAVRSGGGRPVLLPPGGDDDEASATVAGLDAVVAAGGPDIDPARYGAARHERTQPPVPARDAWDFAVTASALRLGVPLLAICRGMQVLNVLRGGTLHQHLPDLTGHTRHGGRPGGFGRHNVRVASGSKLGGIVPADGYLEVPTRHHQAVDLLGDGLAAVAWAEDGVVEAVEAGPSALEGMGGFVLGVQWHPERGDDMRLFTALAAAAAGRAAERSAAARRVTARAAMLQPARRAPTRAAALEPMV
ncbi:MAG: gamma-glutamyl-gamma-aminobutyrate hydrolase family protein [Streptosporangiaceae bacterium]|nr:gamma-glutamyl-gamma-aminobutyrate hydrolase family protein [Streptosporangiaceae bacterium]